MYAGYVLLRCWNSGEMSAFAGSEGAISAGFQTGL